MPWEGVITVKVEAEFTYVIDELWKARNGTDARQQVEQELTDYLGEPFNDQRFIETWKVERDNG